MIERLSSLQQRPLLRTRPPARPRPASVQQGWMDGGTEGERRGGREEGSKGGRGIREGGGMKGRSWKGEGEEERGRGRKHSRQRRGIRLHRCQRTPNQNSLLHICALLPFAQPFAAHIEGRMHPKEECTPPHACICKAPVPSSPAIQALAIPVLNGDGDGLPLVVQPQVVLGARGLSLGNEDSSAPRVCGSQRSARAKDVSCAQAPAETERTVWSCTTGAGGQIRGITAESKRQPDPEDKAAVVLFGSKM